MPVIYVGVAYTEVILTLAGTAIGAIGFGAGYITNDMVTYVGKLF